MTVYKHAYGSKLGKTIKYIRTQQIAIKVSSSLYKSRIKKLRSFKSVV